MWLTSKRPTPVRTAMCSAMTPPPAPGYSTGISHPPKSTILAPSARCVAFSAVFLSGAASALEGSMKPAMRVPLESVASTFMIGLPGGRVEHDSAHGEDSACRSDLAHGEDSAHSSDLAHGAIWRLMATAAI